MEKQTISYRNEMIFVDIIRKKIKNLNLHVKSDGSVYISVPRRAKNSFITSYLEGRAEWIYDAIVKLREKDKAMRTEDISKDNLKVSYLGKTYDIKVILSKINNIEIGDNLMEIQTKKSLEDDKLKNLVKSFLRKQIKIISEDLAETFCQRNYGLFPNYIIEIRKMKSRWGSCAVLKRKIIINSELIYAPIECIEYVVLHELVHFLCANHSKEFYDILQKLMPNYKNRKNTLKALMIN